MPEGGIHIGADHPLLEKPAGDGSGLIGKTIGKLAGKGIAAAKNRKAGGSTPAPAEGSTQSEEAAPAATPEAGPNHPGVSTAAEESNEAPKTEEQPLSRFNKKLFKTLGDVMENPTFKAVQEKAATEKQAAADAEAAKKQEAADAEASKNQQWYDRQNHAHKNLTERMTLQAKLAEEKAAAAHARKVELLNSRQQAGAKPVVAPTAGSSPFSPGSKGTLDLSTMTGGTAAAPAAAPVAEPAAKPARGRKPKATAAPTTEAPAAAPATTPAAFSADVKPGVPKTTGLHSKFDAAR